MMEREVIDYLARGLYLHDLLALRKYLLGKAYLDGDLRRGLQVIENTLDKLILDMTENK